MPKNYHSAFHTKSRSILVPMMKQTIQELIEVVESNDHVRAGAVAKVVVGNAKGVLNEIDFAMSEAPDFVPAEEIAAMYKSGMSFLDVSAKTGMCPTTVRRLVKQAGVKARRKGGPNHSRFIRSHRADIDEMIAKRKAGMTLEQIGGQHGLTRERVRQLLIREGVDTTTKPIDPRRRAAVAAYVSGRSLVDVAEEFEIHGLTLKRWVEADGHKIRSKPRYRPSLERSAEAAKLYQQGFTCAQIKAEMKLGPGYQTFIYRSLAKENVKPNRTKRTRKIYGDNVHMVH